MVRKLEENTLKTYKYGGLTLKVSHKNVCLDWINLAEVVFKAG